ncbi:MAG: PDZ domain-containing protein [Anaerolineales bacterium]|nr:PDZ domain-containing protein [Anaerolineales bacterium]
MGTNNNWLFWIFAFLIASSVVGAVTIGLLAILGVSYEWTGLISPLMTLGVLYMFYRQYPVQAWVLVGCVVFILIGVLAIVSTFTNQEPDAPKNIPEALLTSKNSIDLLGLYDYEYYDYYDYDFETDQDAFLIEPLYNAARTPITIQFPSLETLDGQWAFQSGSVRARGALNGTFQAEQANNWLHADEATFEQVNGASMTEADPYIVVDLPLSERHAGKPIELEAAVTIVYPDSDNQRQTQTLSRTIELYIPTDDFYTYQERHQTWESTQRLRENPLMLGGLVVLMAGAAVGAAVLWRQGAFYASSGGLMVEVRRSSGLQRMGMEAHALKTLSDEARAITETGVFVGVVNAQSPAGRAEIRSGDVLTHFAGKPIHSPRELNRAASRIKRGEVVQVSLIRDRQPLEVFVKF